ncbi:MAG: hypothetical protein Q6367_015970, partial [Candidatus Freyarchaeota archaeon]
MGREPRFRSFKEERARNEDKPPIFIIVGRGSGEDVCYQAMLVMTLRRRLWDGESPRIPLFTRVPSLP